MYGFTYRLQSSDYNSDALKFSNLLIFHWQFAGTSQPSLDSWTILNGKHPPPDSLLVRSTFESNELLPCQLKEYWKRKNILSFDLAYHLMKKRFKCVTSLGNSYHARCPVKGITISIHWCSNETQSHMQHHGQLLKVFFCSPLINQTQLFMFFIHL